MTNSSYSAAARTNLTFKDVAISREKLGHGSFRECYEGTYVGGHRNQQEAACKRFKSQFAAVEREFFAQGAQLATSARAMAAAEGWNGICDSNKRILMSQGSVYEHDGRKYVVEPLIRDFTKFTSNSGWIAAGDAASVEWQVRCMEAFSHFSYHESGGQWMVCDIQGRYRKDKFKKSKCRFELSDPAICSRSGSCGPTDLGEKGMESFFANHRCNEFCQRTWSRPSSNKQTSKAWFPVVKGTSMISSQLVAQLSLTSPASFRLGSNGLMEIAQEEEKENNNKFATVAKNNSTNNENKKSNQKSKQGNATASDAAVDSLEIAGDHRRQHRHQVVGEEVGDSGSDWSTEKGEDGDDNDDNNSGSDWSSSSDDDGENINNNNNNNKGYAEYEDDEVAGDSTSNDHDNSYDVYGDDYGSEYGEGTGDTTDVFFIGGGAAGSDDEKIVGEQSGSGGDDNDDDDDDEGNDSQNTGENKIIFC